jgi:hypothetical protein
MERISSKLIRVFVVTLLCGAAVTTASSQEKQNVVDVNALAARGEAIVNADPDPLVAELRNQQPADGQRGFYIGMGVAEGHTLSGPGKDRLCASLPAAESRSCSIAVLFSVDRNRNAVMAARGAAIAKTDPFVARARTMQPARRVSDRPSSPDALYTLGFDIGIGAAEGHTLPGPGKQKIHDALSLRAQAGFATAVTFSLERNRNADLAATGAAIAKHSDLANARTAEPNILYWLGFDIATAIFGDPALGAQGKTGAGAVCIVNGESFFCAWGHTTLGPRSLRIRDALSDGGRRGFNASMTFHLSRNYKR